MGASLLIWLGCKRITLGTPKTMKKLMFAAIGGVALMTGACNSGNEDQVNNVEMNQPATDLNALVNDAANNAEADALGNQQQQLEQENAANASDNTVNPADADEQNVSGM